MEEARYDMALFREFVGLDAGEDNLPDDSTILRFRHLVETHNLSLQILATVNALLAAKGRLLKSGTVVDATRIAAPCSTQNGSGERDPEMHQTQKGNQWHSGMKAHTGVDAAPGLVRTVMGAAANVNVNDMTQAHARVQGVKPDVFADAGYPAQEHAHGHDLDQLKRAKVEHPFRAIKRQFGQVKVCYRGRLKNTGQLHTLLALSNLWMVQRTLLQEMRGCVRLQASRWPLPDAKPLLKHTPMTPNCHHLKSCIPTPEPGGVVQARLN